MPLMAELRAISRSTRYVTLSLVTFRGALSLESPAPGIIHGTMDGEYYFLKNGGAIGDMSATPSQRATNGTTLNALFTAAAANGKYVDLPPNTDEINNSTGLVIPPGSGFVFRGGRNNTIIKQLYASGTGAPILTIGDGTASVLSTAMDIQGV